MGPRYWALGWVGPGIPAGGPTQCRKMPLQVLILNVKYGIPVDLGTVKPLPAGNNPNDVDDGENPNEDHWGIIHRAQRYRKVWWHANQNTQQDNP